MGGLSSEREISLKSGKAVAEALRRKGHEVVELDVSREVVSQLKSAKVEAAYLALHGKYGEDGTIQGILEWLQIPYTGSSVLASAICYDKVATKEFLAHSGIQTPEYQIYRKTDSAGEWIKNCSLEFPLIVKPAREGSTIGIARAFNKDELKVALNEALRFDSLILVERYIQGREITVGVYQGKALPIVEVIPKSGFYDYESKYTQGKTEYIVPASFSKEETERIQKQSEKIYVSLQCEGGVRVDYMVSNTKEFYFLEVNTIPGMTETSLLPKAAKAVGISFDDLCDSILRAARLKIK